MLIDERDDLVFCIGLSKTGTTSITDALNILSIPTVHYPAHNHPFFKELLNENYDVSSLVERRPKKNLPGYRGFSDIPFAYSYKGFYESYPNSKFILTIREPKGWLNSVRRLLKGRISKKKIHRKIRLLTYNSDENEEWDDEHFLNVLETHNNEVIEFFKGKDNFLVMDICNGDSWNVLCPFLKKPKPKNRGFPWANKGNKTKKK